MSDLQPLIEVELLNTHWWTEWTFFPKQWQSFAEAADDAWLSLPTSCCAGACFTCCCRVKEGLEYVDIGLVSVPLVDIDEDQVLTCIGWLKDSLFMDGKFHKIILQKLI
jgi:ferredoxin